MAVLCACARPRAHVARFIGVAGIGGVALAAGLSGFSPVAAAATCNLTATPASFGSQVAAASAGQTICLTSGAYGTWHGTNKAITVTAAPGNTPTMSFSFGGGASGFTLDGMSAMTGSVGSGAANITIQNSKFASGLSIDGAPTGIVIDHNDFTFPVQSTSGGPNAKIYYDAHGSSPGSAATIKNNDIENGDLDGVHIDGGSGLLIAGNTFANLCDRGVNHTDNIQFVGGTQVTIAGNYVYEDQTCPTQGITSYDGNTHGLIIEDNVVDIPRDWGIELYSDQGSVVVHNTVVYRPKTYTEFHTGGGQIDLDRKSQDPAGSGTLVYDNIATSVDFTNGSTGTQHNNVSGQRALYVGPTNTWAGFKLAPNSPVGLHAASDGLDAGARITPAPPTPAPKGPAPNPQGAGPRLVASFGFDEPSGSTVKDGSGAGNNGTIHGARRTRRGKHGRALIFDGRHDYVSVRDSQSLRFARAMTLAAWVRPSTSKGVSRSVILKVRRRSLSYGLYAMDGRGRAAASVRTKNRYRAGGRARLRARRWSYLAATYNGRVLRVYINGVRVSSRVVHGAIRNVRGPLTIGGSKAWGDWFRGKIDDVRVWRGALSAKAIRRQMRVNA
jgi:hypothetical protein